METVRIITTSPEIILPRLKRLGKIRVRNKSLDRVRACNVSLVELRSRSNERSRNCKINVYEEYWATDTWLGG